MRSNETAISSGLTATWRLHGTSAVLTPYNLIPGGGEKYLLTIVKAMQLLGESVDILVFPENVARDISAVKATASILGADLDWSRTNFGIIRRNSTHITSLLHEYKLFVVLGNEKVPCVHGIGDMNVYMNQFPFDRDRTPRSGDHEKLSSYDFVIVNSEYTRKWYTYYTSTLMESLTRSRSQKPLTIVVYPPVNAEHRYSLLAKDTQKSARKPWILLTGRFFSDVVQGKRHYEAIETFEIMRHLHPFDSADIELFLLGYQMPGAAHVNYTNNIKMKAKQVGNVHVLVNARKQTLFRITSQASIVWSMTGGFGRSDNPADAEHFGIAVLDAMSLGAFHGYLKRWAA